MPICGQLIAKGLNLWSTLLFVRFEKLIFSDFWGPLNLLGPSKKTQLLNSWPLSMLKKSRPWVRLVWKKCPVSRGPVFYQLTSFLLAIANYNWILSVAPSCDCTTYDKNGVCFSSNQSKSCGALQYEFNWLKYEYNVRISVVDIVLRSYDSKKANTLGFINYIMKSKYEWQGMFFRLQYILW